MSKPHEVILDVRDGRPTDVDGGSQRRGGDILPDSLIPEQQDEPAFGGINLGAIGHPQKLGLQPVLHGH